MTFRDIQQALPSDLERRGFEQSELVGLLPNPQGLILNRSYKIMRFEGHFACLQDQDTQNIHWIQVEYIRKFP